MLDFFSIVNFLAEYIYFLGIFLFFLTLAVVVGRQAIINLTCGLYLSFLLTQHFTVFDFLTKSLERPVVIYTVQLLVFAGVTFLTTWLFRRLMPKEYSEEKFESFGQKLLLSFAVSALVVVISFQIFPLASYLVPQNAWISTLFSSAGNVFWWLLVSMVVLFFAS